MLYLRVEQFGADVKIEITVAGAPDGAPSQHMRRVDLRIGAQGVEEVWWIVPETARYAISIISHGEGTYLFEAVLHPTATAKDRLRSRAQDAASEAMGREDHQAAADFARAAEIWQASGDSWQEALAWAEAGRAAERADRPEAMAWLSHALELLRELNRPGQESLVLLWRAQALKKSGRLRSALEDRRRAAELAARDQNPLREARARNDLAVLQLQVGDYEEALDNYRQAAQLRRQAGQRNEAMARNGMAEIYMQLAQMDEAKTELDQALELDDERSRSRTLMLIGWWHHLEGDPETALDFYRAVAARNVVGSPNAGLLDRMGSAHRERGEWDLAELRYKQALAILQSGGGQINQAHTLANLAALFLRTNNPMAGLPPCEQALQIFRRLMDRDSESNALRIRAGLHRQLGDLTAAQHDLAAAVAVLEELRVASGPPTSRATFLAGRIEIYQLYVEVLMALHAQQGDQGWDLEALNISERSRARSLLDLLSTANVDLVGGVDPKLLDEKRWLDAEIAELDSIAATRKNGDLRKRAEQDLEERLRERETLQQKIRQVAISDTRLAGPRPIEAVEVAELLDEETLFLAYGFGADHAFLWWIDSSGTLGSAPLGKVAEIERRAQGWYRLLSAPGLKWDWRERTKRGEDLLDLLLQPAAGPIGGVRRLVIVTDGALRSIPFAALPALADDPLDDDPLDDDPLAADPRKLVSTHEIVHLSSASTLALMRQQTTARGLAPEPLLAVGDPVYDLRDARFGDLVRSPAAGEPDRLKYSGEEVRQILAVADPDCEGCQLLDFEANLEVLLAKDLSRYRILHFAAHSAIDHQSPNLSAIRLSRFDRAGKPRADHLLRFYQIFDLDLPAELVVLSACSTALGEDLPGEGLLGLSRAFNYAGIPRALMTLWDVQDESTSILMTRFYEGLFHHGLSPSAALRRAQLEMIDDGCWQPYHWAAFVLQGEWRPFDVLDTDNTSSLP